MSGNSPLPANIDETTVIHRGISVLTATVGKEIVMMDVASGRYLGFNDIGSDIWLRLEAPRSFGDLIDGLAADYDADRAAIVEDVRKLLTEMAAHGVVKFGS